MNIAVNEVVGALTSAITEAIKPNHSPGHKALRKGRASLPGQAYFLSTTSIFRRPIFRQQEAAREVARTHTKKWVWRDSQVLAWVLMPDHWHGLVVLGQNDQLHNLMGRFKMASSKNVSTEYNINGWLWGRAYHDHALRSDEALRNAARYLVANPIRAGLVNDIGMYPYWDAIWLDPANRNSPWW